MYFILVKVTQTKYVKTLEAAADADDYFIRLCKSIGGRDPNLIPVWTTAVFQAEEQRLRNPKAMNIMASKLSKGAIEEIQTSAEGKGALSGAADWIQRCLELERTQWVDTSVQMLV
jgi:hypothetical protein